jgi:hypothetical protein
MINITRNKFWRQVFSRNTAANDKSRRYPKYQIFSQLVLFVNFSLLSSVILGIYKKTFRFTTSPSSHEQKCNNSRNDHKNNQKSNQDSCPSRKSLLFRTLLCCVASFARIAFIATACASIIIAASMYACSRTFLSNGSPGARHVPWERRYNGGSRTFPQ